MCDEVGEQVGRTWESASHRRLLPYSAYKDSGVPWLGQIPAHWRVLPHRALFGEVIERGHSAEELLSVTISRGVIPQSVLLANSSKKDSSNVDKSNYKLVLPDDITYNKMRAWQGAIGVSKYRGIVSPAYIVVRPRRDGIPLYYHYLFRTPAFIKEAERWSYGITSDQWSLRYGEFKRIYSILPPPDEQRAIARFLEHFDHLTNRYIRAQRRLIDLLTEQKQALIQRAVTRGLDPDVPLKDSGVEWLGKIPAHWGMIRVKHILHEVDKRSVTGQETLLSLRMNHGLVPHDEHFARPGQASTLIGYKLVHPGQVVLNKLQANNGLIFASDVLGVVSPDYAVLDPIMNIDLHYLTTLFRTPLMKHKFRVEAKGLGTGTSGFLRLYWDRFGAIFVCLPPRDEQTRIMDALDRYLEQLNIEINRTQRQIELVREYRTRLIADVVTGKLDVRGAAVESLVEDALDLEDDFEDIIETEAPILEVPDDES